MNYEIIWSNFAENQLDEIFEYYVEKVNLKVAKNLLQKLLAEPNRILNNPEMFQIEDLLIDRENTYRYLICKNYKIIYSVDQKLKLIKIVDVFDTRQNPTKIKRNK
jgi:plasmid stabilization system protein ParE